MKKFLLAIFAMLTVTAAYADDDPVIKMTTTENIGSWFILNIQADGELTFVGLTPDEVDGYYLSSAKEVEIHGKVKRLECCYNNLVSLDVSGDPYLIDLLCDDNDLTSLTIGNNPYLYRLYCGNNALTSLDIKGLTGLEDFSCYGNALTTLDLSSNTELTSLVCRGNALSGVLDLSACAKLKEVSCYDNQLTGIKLAENNVLRHMEMERNCITGSAMTDIMNALPTYEAYSEDEWDDYWGYNLQGLYITETNRDVEKNYPLVSDVQIATDKGWPVYSMNVEEYGEVVPSAFEGYTDSGIATLAKNRIAVTQTGGSIVVSGIALGTDVSLFSANGQKVAGKTSTNSIDMRFDTTHLPAGIYVIKGKGFARKISVK